MTIIQIKFPHFEDREDEMFSVDRVPVEGECVCLPGGSETFYVVHVTHFLGLRRHDEAHALIRVDRA